VNLIFEINFAIFAIFISLFVTEMMGAFVLLLFWKQARSTVLEYIIPIWEVTGTFGAFWVVTADFAYPSLLVPAAELFAPLAIIGLIILVARNASISFAEFIIKRGWLDEEKLYKAYSVSTIGVGLAVLVAVSALFSGAGVSIPSGSSSWTFSFGAWLASPGSVVFVIGTLLIAVAAAPIFFSLTAMKRYVLPFAVAGVGLSVLSYYLYSSSYLSVMTLVPVLLTLLAGILFVASDMTAKIVSNKIVFITVLALIIFSLQPVAYPSILGGAVAIDSVTTSGTMASAYLVMTLIGGALLAIMMGFFVAIAMRPKGPKVPEMAPTT
jgi:cytochrome d ubiquinol oxidase subunit II